MREAAKRDQPGSTGTSRRSLLRLVAAALLLALVRPVLALLRLRRKREAEAAWPRILDDDQPQGLSFHGDILLRQEDALFLALDARCPHLGCRIDRKKADQLVCPCHGSRFTDQGVLLRGPARDSLARFPLRHDQEAGSIVVG